jgi:UDP-N-acetylglucosamine acyltransferase
MPDSESLGICIWQPDEHPILGALAGDDFLSIHPTAIISDKAEISSDATIGPYCVITGKVRIEAGTVVEAHVRIGSEFGEVTIGRDNYIQGGAALGGPAQDWTFEDAYARLEIGDHNRIGENATIHLGTAKQDGVTRIGNHTFLMAYSHVAHDCHVQDHALMINLAQLGGHSIVEPHAVVGGMVAVSQHVRLGRSSFLALGAMVNKDILPFTIAEGHWAVPKATNKVGMRRAGYDTAEIRAVDRAVRVLLDRSLTVPEAIERVREHGDPSPAVAQLLEFAATSKRGLARS